VHTDEQASESARAMKANAYTAGEHVVFGQGKYAPGSPGGEGLNCPYVSGAVVVCRIE